MKIHFPGFKNPLFFRPILRLTAVFFTLLSCFLPFFPEPVRAQEILEIDNFQIDIWPEYDRPDALVIYNISLAEDTILPAQMYLRIPHQTGRPFSLAMRDMGGMLYNLDYNLHLDNDWMEVSFETPSTEIKLEYYDPLIKKDKLNRSYDYTWKGNYFIRTLTIKVQQPAHTTRMTISPDMGSGSLGQDGLTYYTAMLSDVEAEQPVKIHLSYEKTEDTFTTQLISVYPSKVVSRETSGRTNLPPELVWVALGGVAMLACALFFWYSVVKRNPQILREQELRSGYARSSPEAYCQQCGKRVEAEDSFCRSCGAKL